GGRPQVLSLEDLVDPGGFLAAVNDELQSASLPSMTLDDLHSPLRWRSVTAWCENQSPAIRPPTKRRVVDRLVQQRYMSSLIDRRHRGLIQRLHREIEGVLSRPSHA